MCVYICLFHMNTTCMTRAWSPQIKNNPLITGWQFWLCTVLVIFIYCSLSSWAKSNECESLDGTETSSKCYVETITLVEQTPHKTSGSTVKFSPKSGRKSSITTSKLQMLGYATTWKKKYMELEHKRKMEVLDAEYAYWNSMMEAKKSKVDDA